MGQLDGKIALITGAAGGIGSATARLFLAEGARVVLSDLDAASGEALARELGNRSLFIAHDVRDEAQWQGAVERAVAHFEGLHILVNNAGLCIIAGVMEQSVEQIHQVIDINLLGTMIGVKCAAPAIIKSGGGAIINVSSVEGLRAMNAISAYVASKWGVRGFTKSAALELGHRGVRVNSLHPGTVFTKMANAEGLSREEFDRTRTAHYPAQRAADPEQIAKAMLFLASDASSYCMGSELSVDGGTPLGEYAPGLPGALPEPGAAG